MKDNWQNDVVDGVDRLDFLRPWVKAGRLVLDVWMEYCHTTYKDGEESDDGGDACNAGNSVEICPTAANVEVMVNFNGTVRTDQDNTRLQPILQMLYRAHQARHPDGNKTKATDFFHQSLQVVIKNLEDKPEPDMEPEPTSDICFHTYTLRCFREFSLDRRQNIHPGQQATEAADPIITDGDILALEKKENVAGLRPIRYPSFGDGERIVQRLLRKRQFTSVEKLLLRWATTQVPASMSEFGPTLDNLHGNNTVYQDWLSNGIRALVRLGHADVLAAAHARALAMTPSATLFREAELVGTSWDEPLLYLACSRQLPNMAVVRFLVEVCGVDVNSQTMTVEQRLTSHPVYPPPGGYPGGEEPEETVAGRETALHVLARNYHWWGTSQAIPYLVAHGADVTIKNEWGQTVLDIAKYYRMGDADRSERKRVLELLGNKGVL